MADYGLKVSKSGFNVFTADIDDLVLHSEHYGPKIVAQGLTSFNVTSGVGGSATVAHSLGYAPAFMAFLTNNAGKARPPSSWNYDKNYEQFIASSASTQITFSVDSNANTNYEAFVYYYVFAEVGQ